MKKAIAFVSVLLAASFVAQAQNTETRKPILSCKVGDISTAEGLEARATSLAVSAASTCPGPPPPPPPSGGSWTIVQHGYFSNFGAASGPGGFNCGVPYTGGTTCEVYGTQPIAAGDTLIYLPLFYAGGTETLVSVNGEGMITCNQCTQAQWWGDIQISIGYTLSANGGETVGGVPGLQFNFSSSSSGWSGVGFVEAHWSGSGGVAFGGGNESLGFCGTSCKGVSLPSTCNSANALVIQVDFPLDTNPTSVTSPFQFTQGSWGISTSGQSSAPTWHLPMTDPATSNDAICFIGS